MLYEIHKERMFRCVVRSVGVIKKTSNKLEKVSEFIQYLSDTFAIHSSLYLFDKILLFCLIYFF